MKKIIAAFDGLRFSQSTMSYTVYLANHMNAHVVGIFLDDFMNHTYGYEELDTYKGAELEQAVKIWNKKDAHVRDQSVHEFEKICEREGIGFSIHRDKDSAMNELLHESIYADLLIVNRKETFSHVEQDPPTRFIRDLLSDVQCPVLLVPEIYLPVENIILLYDGNPSSVYAIKLFSYLLPAFKHIPTEVVTVKSVKDSLHLPNNKMIKEFMKRHYPGVEHQVLKGDAEIIITRFVNSSVHSLIVLGGYDRGKVSRWFKVSMADTMVQNTDMPLFIAHNR